MSYRYWDFPEEEKRKRDPFGIHTKIYTPEDAEPEEPLCEEEECQE